MFWFGVVLPGADGKVSVRFADPLTGTPPDQLSELLIESGPKEFPPFQVCVAAIAAGGSETIAKIAKIAQNDPSPTTQRRRVPAMLHLSRARCDVNARNPILPDPGKYSTDRRVWQHRAAGRKRLFDADECVGARRR